jgi:amino acid permease
MAFVGGYPVFLPGEWDVPTFLFSYFMIGLFPILFFGWKLVHKSKWRRPESVDLKGEVEEIEEYQRNYVPTPPRLVIFFACCLSARGWRFADYDTGTRSTSGLISSSVVESC